MCATTCAVFASTSTQLTFTPHTHHTHTTPRHFPISAISAIPSQVPKVIADEGRAVATVWAGELMGKTALPPPPDSFANDPANDVAIWLITLAPGGTLTLPPARSGETNRAVYFVEGTEVTMAGATIRQSPTKRVVLRAELECEVVNTGDITADLLILQGRPIGEPVAQHGTREGRGRWGAEDSVVDVMYVQSVVKIYFAIHCY